jgi:hypothetical protein
MMIQKRAVPDAGAALLFLPEDGYGTRAPAGAAAMDLFKV